MNQHPEDTSVPRCKKEEEGKGKKLLKGRKGLGCGGQGLRKGEVWVVGGAYA